MFILQNAAESADLELGEVDLFAEHRRTEYHPF